MRQYRGWDVGKTFRLFKQAFFVLAGIVVLISSVCLTLWLSAGVSLITLHFSQLSVPLARQWNRLYFSQGLQWTAGREVTSDQQPQTTCLFSKCSALYPEDGGRVQTAKVTFSQTFRMSDHLARHLTCTFMFAPCPTKPLPWQRRRLLN